MTKAAGSTITESKSAEVSAPVVKGVAKEQDSDYLKAWKAIPRHARERLTKKQIQMMDKPDLLADSLLA